MRVLLADAQALVREGLKRVTLRIDPSSEFVEAADAATLRAVTRDAPPFDVAWFDETLLGATEVEALRRNQPRLRLLALGARHDDAAAERMLVAGVDARVPRSASTEILAAVLCLALAGNVCVRGSRPSHCSALFAGPKAPGSRRGSGTLNLTRRQYDVLGLVAQGRSNKAIADELGIGLRTVKGHVSVILRALRADNRADAGRTARRWLARAAPVRARGAAPEG